MIGKRVTDDPATSEKTQAKELRDYRKELHKNHQDFIEKRQKVIDEYRKNYKRNHDKLTSRRFHQSSMFKFD